MLSISQTLYNSIRPRAINKIHSPEVPHSLVKKTRGKIQIASATDSKRKLIYIEQKKEQKTIFYNYLLYFKLLYYIVSLNTHVTPMKQVLMFFYFTILI